MYLNACVPLSVGGAHSRAARHGARQIGGPE
jgi:hypothetical protein